MTRDIGFYGDSIALFEGRYGWMNRDNLLERVSWVREGDRIDKPRLQTHDRVCACLLLSLDLCTLRARNGRPTYGSVQLLCEVSGRNDDTYPQIPVLLICTTTSPGWR
jgi:hypothetical protein